MTVQTPTPFPDPTLVSVNDVQLEVFEAGRHNAGNPVVLCHGWPELAYSWRHQLPALVDAGYHVIAPNQRGYGRSSRPAAVDAYDIAHLAGDLVALLDHYGYGRASFVGHDWGAMVVWGLALLHPDRVDTLVNLSLPYQERGDTPWVQMLEQLMGSNYYPVHFNRRPGIADAILDAHADAFLRNLYRTDLPAEPPGSGMAMIDLALAEAPVGAPVMSEADLAVYVSAFKASGFTPGINWYRNLDRNWHLLADVDPVIRRPALMVYGDRDVIPRSPGLARFVPGVEVAGIDCGHWMQAERPHETNALILDWLARRHRR